MWFRKVFVYSKNQPVVLLEECRNVLQIKILTSGWQLAQGGILSGLN